MEQKIQFIRDWSRGSHTVSELCAMYTISRKTGYKWIRRYVEDGPDGLLERSRAPEDVPNRTPAEVEQAILELRLRHPSWGAKKLLHKLGQRRPELELPGRSTICAILSRNGLVTKKPRRRVIGHPGKPTSELLLPNDCWSADFKGQFKTGDGIYSHL